MAERQVLDSCPCGQTYNPDTSPSRCPNCGGARSISQAPDESAEDFADRQLTKEQRQQKKRDARRARSR